MTRVASALFQCPPFPGSTPHETVRSMASHLQDDPRQLLAAIRKHKLGNQFWKDESRKASAAHPSPIYSADDPLALLAALAGSQVLIQGDGPFTTLSGLVPGSDREEAVLTGFVRQYLLIDVSYHSPFTGAPISPIALAALFGQWQTLIAMNSSICAAFGFARWKRETVSPLLWGGSPPPFLAARDEALSAIPPSATIAVWKAKVPASFLEKLEAGPWRLLEVEDGFIRSIGLGANCVPPLSIVADDLGVHYDPARPNRLETMLVHHCFSSDELERARKIREWIVRERISKYQMGSTTSLISRVQDRQHLLVIGQVEDDRSVLFGSSDVRSNLELLRRARSSTPGAYIIYRPHPDVEAGHRRGAIPRDVALEFADMVDATSPISDLISIVDDVHVITSLAGFEALLHAKVVTTYGTPFYAGWGLTTDLVPPPSRRNRQRTIDELVSAVLLSYPRYLDPITNLPCPPEIMIERLLSGVQRQNPALVPARRLVGWTKRTSAAILRRE